MPHIDDLSRFLTAFDQDSHCRGYRDGGIVPGISRAPLEKLEADEADVLRLLHRWREEASTWLWPVNIGAKAASHVD